MHSFVSGNDLDPAVFGYSAGTGNGGSKRLSFISYHDLLASTPLSSVPLSALTSPTNNEPPPHLVAVPGMKGSAIGSGAVSPGAESVGRGREDDGGEFNHEGLGKGLEERLEAVLKAEGSV